MFEISLISHIVAAEFPGQLVRQTGNAYHALRQTIVGQRTDAGWNYTEARLHLEARDAADRASTREQSYFLTLAAGM